MGLIEMLKNLPTANEMQGEFGEQLTKFMTNVDIPEVLVLHDVLIDGCEDSTSQIDLLLIGEKGIYVAEVKMYNEARIYGDGKKSQWYYYKGGNKYNIYSPILQNKNHIKYLKDFLKSFGDVPCFSVIVMICEDFKVTHINENPAHPTTVVLSGLLQLRKAIQLLAEGKPIVFTENQKQEIYNYIKNNQYDGKEKRKEHKERVKEIKKNVENSNKKRCPYCKSPLILRKGKFGEFYGCSKYPACKFTKKKETEIE